MRPLLGVLGSETTEFNRDKCFTWVYSKYWEVTHFPGATSDVEQVEHEEQKRRYDAAHGEDTECLACSHVMVHVSADQTAETFTCHVRHKIGKNIIKILTIQIVAFSMGVETA